MARDGVAARRAEYSKGCAAMGEKEIQEYDENRRRLVETGNERLELARARADSAVNTECINVACFELASPGKRMLVELDQCEDRSI